MCSVKQCSVFCLKQCKIVQLRSATAMQVMQGSGSLLQCDHNGLQMQLGLPPNATAKNTDINSYTNTGVNTKSNKSLIQIPGRAGTQKSYPLFISLHLRSALRNMNTNTNTYLSPIQIHIYHQYKCKCKYKRQLKFLYKYIAAAGILRKLIPLFGVTSLHLISYIISSDYLQP